MRFTALGVCTHKVQTATWQIQVVQAKLFTYAQDCGPEFDLRFVADTCSAICKFALYKYVGEQIPQWAMSGYL